MRKNAYILLAALGLASCNYLEIEPVGKVIPHKTSEYRALLTEGYSRFPYTSSKAYTGLLPMRSACSTKATSSTAATP